MKVTVIHFVISLSIMAEARSCPSTPPNTPTRPQMIYYSDSIFEDHNICNSYDKDEKNVWLHYFEVMVRAHPELVTDPYTGKLSEDLAVGMVQLFLKHNVTICEAAKVCANCVSFNIFII